MTKGFQKIFLSTVILFSLIFGAVFTVLEMRSSAYEGKTTMVLIPRNGETTAEEMKIVEKKIKVRLQGDAFQQSVLDAVYRETGEWKNFSFLLTSPAESVLVFSYTDESVDPYAVRESLNIVRSEAVMTVSRMVDISREIEVRFLDGGVVSESAQIGMNAWIAFLSALVFSMGAEGLLFWMELRKTTREFRRAVQERLQGGSESERWWEKFQKKSDVPTFVTKEGKSVLETIPYAVAQEIPVEKNNFPERSQLTSHVSLGRKSTILTEVPRMKTGSAPINLPIVSEIPEEFVQEERVSKESVRTEEFELPERETILSEKPVLVNPEPSVEELKARLNKLLRGEMG